MKETLRNLLTDVWNVPNVLTMIRLALVPVFAAVLMAGHSMWALGIFCLASLTDAVDGAIARKCHMITAFGKLMDPLADKLLVLTALVCQVLRGIFPWYAMAIVALKEALLIVGSFVMLRRNIVVQANFLGKVGTVCFIAALISSFFHDQFAAWWPLDRVLLWLAVALAIAAFTRYLVAGVKKLNAAP